MSRCDRIACRLFGLASTNPEKYPKSDRLTPKSIFSSKILGDPQQLLDSCSRRIAMWRRKRKWQLADESEATLVCSKASDRSPRAHIEPRRTRSARHIADDPQSLVARSGARLPPTRRRRARSPILSQARHRGVHRPLGRGDRIRRGGDHRAPLPASSASGEGPRGSPVAMKAKPQGRDLPLQFASVETVLRLTNGKNGRGHCPCHDDQRPSLEVKRGREPGRTVVKCWSSPMCNEKDERGSTPLLAHFRKLGYRLGPEKGQPFRSPKRPVTATTSAAFRALTPTERRMYDLIAAGQNPTYNGFMEAGISRSAISVGLRALQQLGFVGVRRSPRQKGCLQYEQNQYWTIDQWLNLEPPTPSKAAMKAAVATAKAMAKSARKGDGDISRPAAKPETGNADLRVSEVRIGHSVKPETVDSDLRVSEVRPRGSDSGTDSYERRRLASPSQDSARSETLMKGESSRQGGSGDGMDLPPLPEAMDPGPMDADGYRSRD